MISLHIISISDKDQITVLLLEINRCLCSIYQDLEIEIALNELSIKSERRLLWQLRKLKNSGLTPTVLLVKKNLNFKRSGIRYV